MARRQGHRTEGGKASKDGRMQGSQKGRDLGEIEGWAELKRKQSLTLPRLKVGRNQFRNGLAWDGTLANDQWDIVNKGNWDYWNCSH